MTVLVAAIVVSGHSISSTNSRKISGHSISSSNSSKWSQF